MFKRIIKISLLKLVFVAFVFSRLYFHSPSIHFVCVIRYFRVLCLKISLLKLFSLFSCLLSSKQNLVAERGSTLNSVMHQDSLERVETFKQEKAKTKANFTRARRRLLALIDDDQPPRRGEVRDECKGLDAAWESAMNVMENLSEEYSRQGDRYNRRKLGREIEQLENEFTEAQNKAQEFLDKTKTESSNSDEMIKQKRSLRIQTRKPSARSKVNDRKMTKLVCSRTWILQTLNTTSSGPKLHTWTRKLGKMT